MNAMFGAALLAGILDILNAIVFWRLYSGTSATTILQSIAAGILGKAAFAGGAGSAALGLGLHLAIMCAMAAVYWLACRRWPWLIRNPLQAGVAYGLLTWAAMNYVVVPLSRAERPAVHSFLVRGRPARPRSPGGAAFCLCRRDGPLFRLADQVGDRVARRERAGERRVEEVVEMLLAGVFWFVDHGDVS